MLLLDPLTHETPRSVSVPAPTSVAAPTSVPAPGEAGDDRRGVLDGLLTALTSARPGRGD
jgi:hypothetical protein